MRLIVTSALLCLAISTRTDCAETNYVPAGDVDTAVQDKQDELEAKQKELEELKTIAEQVEAKKKKLRKHKKRSTSFVPIFLTDRSLRNLGSGLVLETPSFQGMVISKVRLSITAL